MTRLLCCLIAGSLALVSQRSLADDQYTGRSSNADSVRTGPTTFARFSLPTAGGKTVEFPVDPTVQLHVICFLGTECPLARVYGPRLDRLSKKYADRGVRFVGVNSAVQDSLDDLSRYIAEHGISFPIGKDHDCRVAIAAGASRTPEVFVVDRSGVVRYQGRIDDQYKPGMARSSAKVHDLRDAIDQLLADQPVANPRVEAVGCLITLPRDKPTDSDVTFCNQVARILQKNCVECHRSGQIGPFVLDDYDEVVGWADMSLEVIDQGRMPPWHADPEIGSFANARHMPAAEKELLRRWVDAGMPYGDAQDLPPKPQYSTGWRMPTAPDLVLEIGDQPFPVPSEGTVEYQYFVVDPQLDHDTWVRAAQVVPGDSSVVHHCIVFQRPPDGSYLKGAGILAGYVPGQITTPLPPGYAYRIAAGAKLVFQMHYTPNGKPASDLTRLGLVFAKPEEVTHEVFVINGIDTEFEIPPGASDHKVSAAFEWFPKNGELLSITPHMHVRGKSFELFVDGKNGKQPLLRVPAYDFNWQHDYDLATPLPFADIRQVSFAAVFDNSAANPANPDPTEFVTWGDQTWEEMAVTFLRVAEPVDPSDTGHEADVAAQPSELIRQMQWEKALEFADQYIRRLDRNDDQILSPSEVPKSVRAFRFHQFDRDEDGYLTRDEMARNALQRYLEATEAGRSGADGRREL